MIKKRAYFLIIALFMCLSNSYSQNRMDTAYIFEQYHVTGGQPESREISANCNIIICIPFNQNSAQLIEKMLNNKKNQRFHTDNWINDIAKYGTCHPFVSRMPVSFGQNMNSALQKYDSMHSRGASSGILFPDLYSDRSYMKVFKIASEGLLYTLDSYDDYTAIYYANACAQTNLQNTMYSKNKHSGKIEIDTINVQYSITINKYFEQLKPFVFFLETNGKLIKEYNIYWTRRSTNNN